MPRHTMLCRRKESVDVVEPPPRVVREVTEFCERAKRGEPDNLVSKVLPHLPPGAQRDLKEQLVSFPDAVQRACDGRMSYSDMRALYG